MVCASGLVGRRENGFGRNSTFEGSLESICPDMSKTLMPGLSARICSRNPSPFTFGILTSLRTEWMILGTSVRYAKPLHHPGK